MYFNILNYVLGKYRPSQIILFYVFSHLSESPTTVYSQDIWTHT